MSRKTRAPKTKTPQGNVPYGVEYWYVKFNTWTDSMTANSVFWRNVVLAVLLIAAMVVGANFLPFSPAVQSYFVVPASLILFLTGLAIIRRVLPEDRVTIRERFSSRQRRQRGLPFIILALGAFIFANSYLPYLVGGLLFLTLIFTIYNTLRRTPEEIKMDLAGVLDTRDFPAEQEEEINEELYNQLIAEMELEEALRQEEELAESASQDASNSNPEKE